MTIFCLKGSGALSALQRVCANNVDVPVSQVVYTGMLNNQGGYQTDCTVTRLGEHRLEYATELEGTMQAWI